MQLLVDGVLPLEAILKQAASDLNQRLSTDGLGAQTIALSLHLDGQPTLEDTLHLNQPIYSLQRLEWSLIYLLQRMTVAAAVKELEVHLTDLATPQPHQLYLFDEASSRQQVEDIVVDLIPRFGLDVFYDIHPLRQDAPQIQQRYWLEKVTIA